MHRLEELVRLTTDTAHPIRQVDPEKRHSFTRPRPNAFGEVDLPASDPAQVHRGLISLLALTESLFHQHPVGSLYRGNKNTAHARGSQSIRDWAVADREIRFFPLGAMPLNF